MLVCRDVLICGPIPELTTLEEWRSGRETFWREVLGDAHDSAVLSEGVPTEVSFATEWRDLYGDTEDLKSADEIEVWIGCALSDQILLAFIAFLLDLYGIDPTRLSVVQMRERDERVIRGIGELYPEEVRAHPAPVRLDEDQFVTCLDVWGAITSDSPEPMIAAIERGNSSLPLMHAALEALVYRFPDSRTGLSLWDEMMLGFATRRQRKAAMLIGSAMTAELEDGHPLTLDSVGDLYLYYRLRNLAQPTLAEPLMKATSLSAPMRYTEYALTDFGPSVQAGERNAIDVNGIDDWICGVHLSSEAGNVWVREGGAIVPRSG